MMSTQGSLVVSKDGVKIWAQAAGLSSNPAVIFVHGFSSTAMIFEKQFSDPEMLKNLYMIRFDVRGHGRSDQPLDAESYASIHHAEDFKAVCEEFNVTTPFMAGWSLGGCLATDVVAAYGADAIRASILLGAIPYRSMHSQIVHPVILGIIPGLLAISHEEFHKTAAEFPISCVADGFEIPTQDFLSWAGALAIQNPLVRVHSLSRTQDESALVAARKTIPFLSIHGTEDKHMWAKKMENFMKNNFDNVEFHEIAGAGHAPFYEQPEVVNKYIIEFVHRILL